MSDYNYAEGVEFLSQSVDGNNVHLSISMPTDEDGFFGRDCPSCKQQFRVSGDDYEALPDSHQTWCVYCGHRGDGSDFITDQQEARVTRAGEDFAEQLVDDLLSQAFGPGRSSSISYQRSSNVNPAPLPEIKEERVVRQRCCSRCSFNYAVFGEHRVCPQCGKLPALDSALDSLLAETIRLDVLTSLSSKQLNSIRENGVLDRTYADAIENVVGIVEATAERVFLDSVTNPEPALRGKGKVFQRLNDMADLFLAHMRLDIRGPIAAEWSELEESWAARHVFTHCDGIIDEKYLQTAINSPLVAGQRLRASEDFARRTLLLAERLVRTICGVMP